MRGAGAILLKDLRIEWRTKESLASVFVLGVLLLVVFTVAHDPDMPILLDDELYGPVGGILHEGHRHGET